ncbi:hypothetical protein RUND412_009466 [Rhizina undulata]
MLCSIRIAVTGITTGAVFLRSPGLKVCGGYPKGSQVRNINSFWRCSMPKFKDPSMSVRSKSAAELALFLSNKYNAAVKLFTGLHISLETERDRYKRVYRGKGLMDYGETEGNTYWSATTDAVSSMYLMYTMRPASPGRVGKFLSTAFSSSMTNIEKLEERDVKVTVPYYLFSESSTKWMLRALVTTSALRRRCAPHWDVRPNNSVSLYSNFTRKSQQITLYPPAAAVAKPFDTFITAPTTYFLHTEYSTTG